MHTAAILPVKRFAAAKRRLGGSIADDLRPLLARAMVSDVLDALAQSPSIELTIVVTGEPSLLDPAQDLRALLVEDPAEDGQSAAVALGVERALAEGMDRVLSIPGDCPAIDPTEIEALLGRRDGKDECPTGPEATFAPEVVIARGGDRARPPRDGHQRPAAHSP